MRNSNEEGGAGVGAAVNRADRVREWIRSLTAIPARFAGSAAERNAAERIGEWLRDLGARETSLAPVVAPPKAGAVLALHCGVAVLALYLGGFAGAVLAVLAAWSFRTELRKYRLVLSRILGTSQSVNVIGRFGNDAPARRVIVTAHIDTTQAGWLFSRELADFFAWLSATLRRDGGAPPGPGMLPEALMNIAALLAVAGWMGARGFFFGLLELIVLGLLILAAVLTLQWANAPATPGANDNASAVAAMLLCTEKLKQDLPADVELWAVGTGAEEVGCVGMRHLVNAHPEWDRDSTFFVNFECVGGGSLHWVRSEGTLAKSGYPPMLNELARRIAASGSFGEVTGRDLMAGTDGHVAAERGYPTVSLITLQPNGVPLNYHRIEDTVDAIDCDTVVRAADLGTAIATAALAGKSAAIDM